MYKAQNNDLEGWESFDESEFEFIIRVRFPLFSTRKHILASTKKGKLSIKDQNFSISDIDERYYLKFTPLDKKKRPNNDFCRFKKATVVSELEEQQEENDTFTAKNEKRLEYLKDGAVFSKSTTPSSIQSPRPSKTSNTTSEDWDNL